MPQVWRATWFLRYGQAGYSFSLFRSGDTIGYQDMFAVAERFASGFMPLLGVGVELPYIRVSKEKVHGDALTAERRRVVVSSTFTQPNPRADDKIYKAIVEDNPDQPWTAAKLVWGASATAKGHTFLRLIPDSIVIQPNGLSGDTNWDNRVETLINLAEKDQWGIMAIPKGPGVRQPISLITQQPAGAPPGAPLLVKLVNPLAANFPINSNVQLGLLKPQAAKFLVGKYKVENIIGLDELALAPHLNADPQVLWPQVDPAYVGPGDKVFQPITAAFSAIEGVTERRAGRPFGLLVGRRRVRRI